MEEKVDLLLENGYSFKFLLPGQGPTSGNDYKLISIEYNLSEENLDKVLNRYIEHIESPYRRLKDYVDSKV